MSCRIGGTFLTPILAIAGLVAAGTVGYKVLSGGCTTCTDSDAKAAMVNVANDHGDCSLCADHKECESHTASKSEGCCSETKTVAAEAKTECCASKEAAVTTVAAEGKTECCASKEAAVKTVAAEAKKEGCCSEAKTEKVCKEGTDGCTGDGKDGCCGGCEGEKKEEKKEGAQ